MGGSEGRRSLILFKVPAGGSDNCIEKTLPRQEKNSPPSGPAGRPFSHYPFQHRMLAEHANPWLQLQRDRHSRVCEWCFRLGRMCLALCVMMMLVWNLKPCHQSNTMRGWQSATTGNFRGQGWECGIPSVRVSLMAWNLVSNARKELTGVERSSCGFTVCGSCCYKGTDDQV